MAVNPWWRVVFALYFFLKGEIQGFIKFKEGEIMIDYEDLLDFIQDNDLSEGQTIKTLLDAVEDSEGEADEEGDHEG
jgi:hypothetical protein